MSEEIRHPDGRIEHPSVHHEPTDVDFRWILGTVIAAGILGIVIHYVILAYFEHTRGVLAETRKSRYPLAAKPNWSLPPEPRLEQLDRLAGISSSEAFLRQKAKLEHLRSLGPVDEQGFVHIPIDRAIGLLANKLPSRSAPSRPGVILAGTCGLLMSARAAPGPLLAAVALFPGRSEMEAASFAQRDQGLLSAGEPNSGRLFNRRMPRWYEP
jgi:hypothetical protein